jgi:predicted AlkP superfamily pyrophosphatase or phosphodiesterase
MQIELVTMESRRPNDAYDSLETPLIEENEGLFNGRYSTRDRLAQRKRSLLILVSSLLLIASTISIALIYYATGSETPLLILISLDGTRPEYLKRNATPHIQKIIDHGVMYSMVPSFPSITFPNHYTLVTGRYPGNHGIVANHFYDHKLNDSFLYTNPINNVDPKWWLSEPIWTTAMKNGLRAATYFWPGSEHPHDGKLPSIYKKFNNSVTASEKIHTALEWIDLPVGKRPNIITLYFQDIDHIGHVFGPDSPELNQVLKMIDENIGVLYSGLEKRRLLGNTELVIVSDHGMRSTNPKEIVFLDDIINFSTTRVLNNGPLVLLEPLDQNITALYKLLKAHGEKSGAFQTWLKEEIPASYHYISDRVSPIVLESNGHGMFWDTRHGFEPDKFLKG